jgi:glycogen debranching enzyme
MKGMKSYGLVGYPGWDSIYNSLDAFPSIVISSCNYIIGSKDIKWAEENYVTIKGWLDEQMKRDVDKDGLVSYELSGNSGSWGKYRPSNWWDTIGFGHDDAYSNALTFDALNLFVTVSKMLGKNEAAINYQQLADNLNKTYFKTFYNQKTGVIAGWRSQDGNLHDYYFMFVNAIAIYYDLVPKDKQKEIMQTLWFKMKEVGLTNFKYGLPGNLISVRYEDYFDHRHQFGGGQKQDGTDAFQIYENGGLSANYVYYILKAFQKTGLKEYADKIIDDMLVSFELGDFQGSCADEKTKDWKDWNGNCWGYEGLLCDGYLTFLAMNPSL